MSNETDTTIDVEGLNPMYKMTSKSGLVHRYWANLKRNKLALVGLLIVAVISLSVIFAGLLSGIKPNVINMEERLQSPTFQHILGTDSLGRDVFSRILHGGRISILIGLSSALGAALIGVVLGSISGYFGGWFDKIILRLSEVVMTFPGIILILIFIMFMGQGILNLIIIFSITGWIGEYRLVRGRFLSLKNEYFVEACRAFGIGKTSIIFKHILPNALTPVIVAITLSTAGYILAEAGLGYLGLGVPPDVPTWGNILNAAQSMNVITNYPWLWLAPGLAISIFVLGINFLGDGLRDLIDPNQ